MSGLAIWSWKLRRKGVQMATLSPWGQEVWMVSPYVVSMSKPLLMFTACVLHGWGCHGWDVRFVQLVNSATCSIVVVKTLKLIWSRSNACSRHSLHKLKAVELAMLSWPAEAHDINYVLYILYSLHALIWIMAFTDFLSLKDEHWWSTGIIYMQWIFIRATPRRKWHLKDKNEFLTMT